MKRSIFLAGLLIAEILWAMQEATTGTVQGTVVDECGRPVANVKVYPMSENGGFRRVVPFAITDDDGNFTLHRVLPGENRLFPVFTEAGYPDGRSGIFARDPSLYETVNIEPGQTLRGVVLKLPKKGAVFRAHITDISTGRPVLTSRIRITRPDVPEAFYESGPDLQGQFEIVLASNISFRVEIRAANYKEWRYSDVDGQGSANLNLTLKSEAIKEITVRLQKVAEVTDQR